MDRKNKDSLFKSIRSDSKLFSDLMEKGTLLLKKFVQRIHPEALVHLTFQEDDRGTAKTTLSPKTCFLCGQPHEVTLISNMDLSLEYYCLDKQKTLFENAIVAANVVQPRNPINKENAFPESMKHGGIYYPEVPSPNIYQARPLELKSENATYLLALSMGSGKTYQIGLLLQDLRSKNPNLRVISVGHRISIVEENARNYNLKSYQEISDCLRNVPHLSIQLDSLSRILSEVTEGKFTLVDLFTSYDVVILDESESILKHLSASTLKEKPNLLYQVLFCIVKTAKILIVADAGAGILTQTFLQEILQTLEKDIQSTSSVTNYQEKNPGEK